MSCPLLSTTTKPSSMGFDLFIQLHMNIHLGTGLPFLYKIRGTQVVTELYDPETYRVPEEHRKYLTQRGSHFHHYIQDFVDNHTNNTDASTFLMCYPSWESIKEECNEDELAGWTEEDHNGFRKALEWMKGTSAPFMVYWSY